jgi:hypothetical protein
VTAILGSHTAQARQMLRKLLTDKIKREPVGRARERGYRFRGALCIERLIGGEALQTSLTMVAQRDSTVRLVCSKSPSRVYHR